jgi:hypothetical protein
MLATFSPRLSRTPIADAYRAIVERSTPVDLGDRVFDASPYDPHSVRNVCRHFRKRMVDEYASTTVYSGLVAQLMEANAPLDASAVTLRMAQDEFRHAELCGRWVAMMGGTIQVARETAVKPLPLHEGVGVEERALRNVLVTSISESYSAAFFAASLETMVDPFLRDATRSLLADEVLHARFGFYYLSGVSDWLKAHPGVRASIAKYLRLVFATCEREFLTDEQPPSEGADDAALGLVPPHVAREVFVSTMQHAVAPALDSFGLDGTGAFARRSL